MKTPMLNVARVWCGAIPRRGSGENAGTHMRYCQDCRRVKRLFNLAVAQQSGSAQTQTACPYGGRAGDLRVEGGS